MKGINCRRLLFCFVLFSILLIPKKSYCKNLKAVDDQIFKDDKIYYNVYRDKTKHKGNGNPIRNKYNTYLNDEYLMLIPVNYNVSPEDVLKVFGDLNPSYYLDIDKKMNMINTSNSTENSIKLSLLRKPVRFKLFKKKDNEELEKLEDVIMFYVVIPYGTVIPEIKTDNGKIFDNQDKILIELEYTYTEARSNDTFLILEKQNSNESYTFKAHKNLKTGLYEVDLKDKEISLEPGDKLQAYSKDKRMLSLDNTSEVITVSERDKSSELKIENIEIGRNTFDITKKSGIVFDESDFLSIKLERNNKFINLNFNLSEDKTRYIVNLGDLMIEDSDVIHIEYLEENNKPFKNKITIKEKIKIEDIAETVDKETTDEENNEEISESDKTVEEKPKDEPKHLKRDMYQGLDYRMMWLIFGSEFDESDASRIRYLDSTSHLRRFPF